MTKNNVIFGIRAIHEAIESGKSIEKIIMKPGLKGSLYNDLFQEIQRHSIPVQKVPIERLNYFTTGNHQGVVAIIAPVDYQDIEKLVGEAITADRSAVILILDGVTDVRNFGAIARTAECAGIMAIVIPDKGSAPVNGDSIKTSAGALYRVPVCRVPKIWYTMKFLKESGFRIIAVSDKSGINYREADYSGNFALVMGAEDKGISSQVLKMCDAQVNIPLKGDIGSLNVSVAAGIVVFEAIKSRYNI